MTGLAALLCTAAVAGVAADLGGYVDRDIVARDGFFEVELELIAQVRATEYLAGHRPPGAATENIAEDVAENVAKPSAPKPPQPP